MDLGGGGLERVGSGTRACLELSDIPYGQNWVLGGKKRNGAIRKVS